MGTNSPFTIETFGRPRRISVDPDHHVLTNSSDVKLRSSILRGQAMQQQGDLSGALTEFNKALDLNKNSSLAHYRIAEIFFFQRNYQSSANAYRAASMATAIRAGPKSGAIFNWERFSILPASANAQSANTVRRCKPTTTPSAR